MAEAKANLFCCYFCFVFVKGTMTDFVNTIAILLINSVKGHTSCEKHPENLNSDRELVVCKDDDNPTLQHHEVLTWI